MFVWHFHTIIFLFIFCSLSSNPLMQQSKWVSARTIMFQLACLISYVEAKHVQKHQFQNKDRWAKVKKHSNLDMSCLTLKSLDSRLVRFPLWSKMTTLWCLQPPFLIIFKNNSFCPQEREINLETKPPVRLGLPCQDRNSFTLANQSPFWNWRFRMCMHDLPLTSEPLTPHGKCSTNKDAWKHWWKLHKRWQIKFFVTGIAGTWKFSLNEYIGARIESMSVIYRRFYILHVHYLESTLHFLSQSNLCSYPK